LEMPFLSILGEEIEAELILFDLDGTLLDASTRHRNLARARIDTIGRLVGGRAVDEWARLSGVDNDTFEIDPQGPLARAPRREDLIVASAAIYVSGHPWHVARELAERAYKEADRLQETLYRPSLMEGVGEALRSLKEGGFKLGIATNGESTSASALMKELGLLDLFNVILGADSVVEAKPAPEMALLACERVGVPPGRALFVGDQQEDMRAGRTASVKAVVSVNNSDQAVMGLADVSLNSVAEIRVVPRDK
jgi:phosphoglycolate phosphatase